MIYIGIDPGKSGAMAIVWGDGQPAMSVCRFYATYADQAEWLSGFDLTDPVVAVIEKVSSSPQMGVVSAFSFGKSQGFLLGLLTAYKIPYHEVTPQKWQKAMGCMSGGDKNVTKHAAQKLWPHLKITHRDADARLIAEYGRRFINVGGEK
jgi:Holliday junction resolvasome RuvABC endonuclease subunit